MNAAPLFVQPKIAQALCLQIAESIQNHSTFSARTLAESIAEQFPDTPRAALRVLASMAVRLQRSPARSDVDAAGLEDAEREAALEVFFLMMDNEFAALEASQHGGGYG